MHGFAGDWREEVEEVKTSALLTGGECDAAVMQPLPGTQGCVVLSPPLPRLLDDSNNFLLSPFCEISLGQE